MARTTAAVIPVFHAPEGLAERVGAIAEQVDLVVLVDDGSQSLHSLALASAHVLTIELEENQGIGSALNTGVDRARVEGATHVLTLDQDSSIPVGYVAELLRILDASTSTGMRVGAVVPEYIQTQRVLVRDGFAFDPIQSGQLVPLSVIDEIGPFRAEFFIDAVDSEFTVRAEEYGYRFVIAPDARIGHALGDLVPLMVWGRQVVVAGKPRHVLYHSPFRTYYMVRNSVVLIREHGARRRAWMSIRTWKMAEMVIGCVLLSPDRGAQWRALSRGMRDGLAGVSGRITAATLQAIAGRRHGR